jgi:hypothetical protein
MNNIDLSAIKGLVREAVDLPRIETGRKRQRLVGEGQTPDYAPLLLGYSRPFLENSEDNREHKLGEHLMVGGVRVPEIEDYPHYGLAEQIASPEVMLYEALWEVLGQARTHSDAQLSVRPSLVWALPTCFGMKWEVFDDGTVWFPDPMSIDSALDVDIDEVEKLGEMPRVLEYLHFFRENVPRGIKVCCPMVTGPLLEANNILGQDIWLLFYEQPEKLCRLLARLTDVIAKLLKLQKEIVGEPMDCMWTGPLFMSNGGVKIGNDSVVMLSPEMFRKYVAPEIAELCRAFSGGYHHSCGHFPKQLKVVNEMPEVTTVNMGQPSKWDLPQTVHELHRSGKLYYGGWPRRSGEAIDAYLRRGVELCGPERNRAILFAMGERFAEKGSDPWPEPRETMDLWHRIQDEVFPR